MEIKRQLKKLLWKHLISSTRNSVALQRLQGVLSGMGYVPWTSSAVSPVAVETMLNDIVINRRSTIVECGGGVSTFLTARLLKELGREDAHVYTIDDNQAWVDVLRDSLVKYEIEEYVTIIEAPLQPTDLARSASGTWYSTDALKACDGLNAIDLLFVDGPKAGAGPNRLARYPALPFFADRLSERCTVVLDDIDREGEAEIAAAWSDRFGMDFDHRLLHGSIAIATRGSAFNYT